MTDRTKALAIIWGDFWQKVEAKGQPLPNQPGYLGVGLEPIDEALREAISKAFDDGYLSAVVESVASPDRRN